MELVYCATIDIETMQDFLFKIYDENKNDIKTIEEKTYYEYILSYKNKKGSINNYDIMLLFKSLKSSLIFKLPFDIIFHADSNHIIKHFYICPGYFSQYKIQIRNEMDIEKEIKSVDMSSSRFLFYSLEEYGFSHLIKKFSWKVIM